MLIGDCHCASLLASDGRIERGAPSIRLRCQYAARRQSRLLRAKSRRHQRSIAVDQYRTNPTTARVDRDRPQSTYRRHPSHSIRHLKADVRSAVTEAVHLPLPQAAPERPSIGNSASTHGHQVSSLGRQQSESAANWRTGGLGHVPSLTTGRFLASPLAVLSPEATTKPPPEGEHTRVGGHKQANEGACDALIGLRAAVSKAREQRVNAIGRQPTARPIAPRSTTSATVPGRPQSSPSVSESVLPDSLISQRLLGDEDVDATIHVGRAAAGGAGRGERREDGRVATFRRKNRQPLPSEGRV